MPKKLIILFNRLAIGGQALDTLPQAYYLKDEFDILVLYGEPEPDESEANFLLEKYPGIHTKKIIGLKRNINPVNDIKTFLKIRKQIKEFNCDILHTHGFKPGLMGRLAGYLSGVPCIIHTYHGHHFHSYYNKLFSAFIIRFERFLCRMNTRVVAISSEQCHELTNVYKIVPQNKIAIVHLGIAAEFASGATEKRKAFRSRYTLDVDTIAIGIVGRIVPIKNHSLFVNIAAILLASNKNKKIKFFIIGDGNLKKDVQNDFERLGIACCNQENFNTGTPVVFTSWISEISEAMHGLDIITLTSHNEGTPMSLIEAQLCGKPVVATDVGGTRDTFINNETGYLIPAGDEHKFVEQLTLLIGNAMLRASMGSKAIDFANKKFSKKEEIANLRLLYNSCIQSK